MPPAGVIPNFDKPPNLDVYLYVTAALAMSFTTCAIIIRIYTKHFLLRSMGYEDCKFGGSAHSDLTKVDTLEILRSLHG